MQYTAAMPVDVAAEVIANTPLSSDYNVLALAAPAIAAAASPGQFVMVKVARGHDPLLRRPFSVFEVLRDARGAPSGISLLNKRIGVSTELIYRAAPGTSVACLGPLGRPFLVVDPPDRGVDGGRRRRAGAVRRAGRSACARAASATTLFYGARRAEELFYLDLFRELGVDARADDRRRQPRRAWPHRRAARTPARRDRAGGAGHDLRVRPRRACSRRRPGSP